MVNRWLTHVKSVKRRNPGLKFSRVLKLASKSWRKGQSGGASVVEDAIDNISEQVGVSEQTGGRRGRRSRRRRKKRRTRKRRTRKRRSRKRRTRKRRRRRRRRR